MSATPVPRRSSFRSALAGCAAAAVVGLAAGCGGVQEGEITDPGDTDALSYEEQMEAEGVDPNTRRSM